MSVREVWDGPGVGRIFEEDWSLENVAALLRVHAQRGFLRGLAPEDLKYRNSCAARHVPTGVSVIFTRDAFEGARLGWHASICFIGEGKYMPWNEEMAERWLSALYGPDRQRIKPYGSITDLGKAKGVRHFLLEVPTWKTA